MDGLADALRGLRRRGHRPARLLRGVARRHGLRMDRGFSRLENALAASFSMVMPDGTKLERAQVIGWLRQARGAQAVAGPFRIAIEDREPLAVRRRSSPLRYVEEQCRAAAHRTAAARPPSRYARGWRRGARMAGSCTKHGSGQTDETIVGPLACQSLPSRTLPPGREARSPEPFRPRRPDNSQEFTVASHRSCRPPPYGRSRCRLRPPPSSPALIPSASSSS